MNWEKEFDSQWERDFLEISQDNPSQGTMLSPMWYKDFIRTLIQQTREETIKEFVEGKRCMSCGELKGDGGELSDTCSKCLEEN